MPQYTVTYLDVKHSTKHSINVEADSDFIAVRFSWDKFVEQRQQRRYGVPLKDDFAVYSVVETSRGETEVNPSESDSPDT